MSRALPEALGKEATALLPMPPKPSCSQEGRECYHAHFVKESTEV